MRKLISIISITILGAGVAAYAASSPVSNGSSGTGTAMVQQDATWILHGTVVDSENVPVIGAGVINLNTKTGDITNNDGKFGVSVKVGDRLEVSCIGYSTREIVVTSQDNIVVILENDSELLEEVVVMGYGTQKKKLVTGSTVNVTSDKIAAVNPVDALGSLQSQAAGLSITQNSGQPGESYKVFIRGLGTLGASEPIYVIDGVPGGDITAIAPNDIESIDVLKDAASSAIYGARAANGVILVTTKQGKAGKISVTYDGYYGVQNANTNGFTPLNAKQYMEIINKSYEIAGNGENYYDFASLIPKQYAMIQNGTWNGTNWFKESLNKNAPITNHSVNITGGNEISRFALGFTYYSQEGTIGLPAKPNYDRYTVRFNSDYSLLRKNNKDVIRFGENVTFTMTDKSGVANGNNYNNSIRDLIVACPLLPAYNEEGELYIHKDMVADGWDFNQDFKNPLAYIKFTDGNNDTKKWRIHSNFFLEAQPIAGLTLKSSLGLQYEHSDYRKFVPAYDLSANKREPNNKVTQSQHWATRWSWENTANYVRSFGLHNVDALVGMALEKWGFGNEVKIINSNSIFDDFEHAYIDNARSVNAATEIYGTPNDMGALRSFFGRINYNYDETYMLSLVMRVDGSSNFAKGHRTGYFPSVSAGWVVTNEEFMKKTAGWLDFLKIRGSWGQNGNCDIKPFQYLTTDAFDAPYYPADKDTPAVGGYPNIIANPDVTWETSQQLDLGFDARLLRSRLGLSFDWYDKRTKDWLVDAPMPKVLGAKAPFINGGEVTNKGFEILLSWNDMINKDFSYGASLTFSKNKNKVTRIANSEGLIQGEPNILAQNTDRLYRAQVGYPIGYFYGYKTDGVIQNDADLQKYIAANCNGDAANSLQGAGLQAGDLKFVDVNGDGVVNQDDKTMIGDPHPDVNVGLSFNIAYKGFDFAVSGYGAFGQQIAKSYRHFSNRPDENYATDVYTKYWTGEGSTNRYPRFCDGKNTNMSEISQLWIEDGDFFKISNITLGYDLKRVAKFLPVSKFRIYVSAQNMFTFTNYSGMDPEIGYGDKDKWASGIDVGNYPSANVWMGGLSITF